MALPRFSPVSVGLESWSDADMLPRHRHALPYAAVVLSGGYVEAGDEGRTRVGAGDVLIHRAFDAHLDRFSRGVTEILNLPIPPGASFPPRGRVPNPEALNRLAARDPSEAVRMLFETFVVTDREEQDWPDLLAKCLARHLNLCIRSWADEHRLAPASVSRGFRLAYGTSPRRFRAEWRARNAWRAIINGREPLAQVAHDHGFADQPHMNRAVLALTGRTPGAWRAAG